MSFDYSKGAGASAPFIGAWRLRSYQLRLASGEVTEPFGDRPMGRLLYETNGQMSAQVIASAPAPFVNSDPADATAEESDRAWRNYVGYWGKFTVNTEARTVVHHVEGAWFPNWIGQDQVRSFRFEDNRLTLEADSPAWHAKLVWERID